MTQHFHCIGNLGRDPDIRYTQSGDPVANFSVAVTERYKGEERTEWVNCVAFKRTAEIVSEYLRRGSKVYVAGKLKTSTWEQDGQKRYKTEIMVNQVQMLSPKQAETKRPEPDASHFEDDIPF